MVRGGGARGLCRRTDAGAAGKLTAAGRAWATGGAPERDQIDEDAEFFGFDPALMRGPPEPEEETGLWACHAGAMAAFCAVASQWRRAGERGVIVGLDFAGCEAGLRLAGIAVTPGEWDEVQAIALGAAEALNERLRA